MRSTHTVAMLELSPQAYEEIAQKLRDAEYDHAFVEDFIDMTGIGVSKAPPQPTPEPNWYWRAANCSECGPTVRAAMDCTDFFVVDEIGSMRSATGPNRFYVKVPAIDPAADDEEILGFDTEEEAVAAAAQRKDSLVAMGRWQDE